MQNLSSQHWGKALCGLALAMLWLLPFGHILLAILKSAVDMNALPALQGSHAQSWPNNMLTAAVLPSLPTLLLFVLLRRQSMQGLRV